MKTANSGKDRIRVLVPSDILAAKKSEKRSRDPERFVSAESGENRRIATNRRRMASRRLRGPRIVYSFYVLFLDVSDVFSSPRRYEKSRTEWWRTPVDIFRLRAETHRGVSFALFVSFPDRGAIDKTFSKFPKAKRKNET